MLGHCLTLVPFFFRSSNDGLKADILIKFQFPHNNVGTLKRQADSILHKKLQSTQSFMKRDISLPNLRGKKDTFFFSQELTLLIIICLQRKLLYFTIKQNHFYFRSLSLMRLMNNFSLIWHQRLSSLGWYENNYKNYMIT